LVSSFLLQPHSTVYIDTQMVRRKATDVGIVSTDSETKIQITEIPRPFAESTDICADKQLYLLRQSLLELMGDAQRLDDLYKSSTPVLEKYGPEEQGLFSVMHQSWVAADRLTDALKTDRKQDLVMHDCIHCLNDIAQKSPVSVSVLADCYSAWYSSKALRYAHCEDDFLFLAPILSRAIVNFSMCPQIDQLVWAELLQVIVDFISRAVNAGAEDVCAKLPLRAINNKGEQIEGHEGTRQLARMLWREAFTVFWNKGCFQDATHICSAMILLNGSQDFESLHAMHLSVSRMETFKVRQAFAEYFGQINKSLVLHGKITTGLLGLPDIFKRMYDM